MYGVFDPVVVYGVVERDEDKVICKAFLERFGLDLFVTGLVRMHASNFVYGVQIGVSPAALSAAVARPPPKKAKQEVTDFLKALRKKGVDLGKPSYVLALWSNEYEKEQTEYLDDDDDDDDDDDAGDAA